LVEILEKKNQLRTGPMRDSSWPKGKRQLWRSQCGNAFLRGKREGVVGLCFSGGKKEKGFWGKNLTGGEEISPNPATLNFLIGGDGGCAIKKK